MKHDFKELPGIIDRYSAEPESLVMVLQDIQKEYRYLPCEALRAVSEKLNVPLSKVFSVSTFYNAFSLNPRGEKTIRVCVGTACHVRGADQIKQQFETLLKIQAGQTTEDMKFSLEVVGCVGACAMAPVVIEGDKYHAEFKVNQVQRMVRKK